MLKQHHCVALLLMSFLKGWNSNSNKTSKNWLIKFRWNGATSSCEWGNNGPGILGRGALKLLLHSSRDEPTTAGTCATRHTKTQFPRHCSCHTVAAMYQLSPFTPAMTITRLLVARAAAHKKRSWRMNPCLEGQWLSRRVVFVLTVGWLSFPCGVLAPWLVIYGRRQKIWHQSLRLIVISTLWLFANCEPSEP